LFIRTSHKLQKIVQFQRYRPGLAVVSVRHQRNSVPVGVRFRLIKCSTQVELLCSFAFNVVFYAASLKPNVRVVLAALESLCTNESCSSVRLIMDRDVGTFPLSEQQKDVLRDKNVRLVSRFYFDCQRSEEPLDDYGEGRVDISLPFYYDDITLYAMDDEGNLTELEKSFENMELKFTISEGSIFVLVK